MQRITLNTFSFQRKYHDALSNLSDEQYGRFMRAICVYALYGESPDFKGVDLTLWNYLQPAIDKSRRKANGKSGRKSSGDSNSADSLYSTDSQDCTENQGGTDKPDGTDGQGRTDNQNNSTDNPSSTDSQGKLFADSVSSPNPKSNEIKSQSSQFDFDREVPPPIPPKEEIPPITPKEEKTPIIPTEETSAKVRKNALCATAVATKTKETASRACKPASKAQTKGKQQRPKSLQTRARQVFEEHYLSLVNRHYYWTSKDAGHMRHLLEKLQFDRQQSGLPIGDDALLDDLQQLLASIRDPWIIQHFEVAIVNSQYNKICSAATAAAVAASAGASIRAPGSGQHSQPAQAMQQGVVLKSTQFDQFIDKLSSRWQ